MKQPNILVIVSDQLAQRAVGAYGGTLANTPNIDSIAAGGVAFRNAYTPCPLCMPARAAFWTGRHPHETGVFTNAREARIPEHMPTLGTLLGDTGYRCVHYGKGHDCGGLRGFDVVEAGSSPVEETPPWTAYYDTTEDRYTAERSVEFLNTHGKSPYLLVADLNNPHDICLWIGDHAGKHDDEPIPGDLPELPANFTTGDLAERPLAIRENGAINARVAQTQGWTPENYRYYLAAYRHYTALADSDVGSILTALRSRPDAADTWVVFLVDHGEGIASHGMVTKGGHFYEEVTRVPFIVAGPGVVDPGRLHNCAPVSLLDFLPTVCELASVQAPSGLPGRSLRPWLVGEPIEEPHGQVVSVWQGGGPHENPARMLRGPRYKYVFYARDGGEELYDLDGDPGETRNLVHDTAASAVLREHRQLLHTHCLQTHDPFASLLPA